MAVVQRSAPVVYAILSTVELYDKFNVTVPKVELPELSIALLDSRNNAGVNLNALQINCGHNSLAIQSYILFAGIKLKWFLLQSGSSDRRT